MTTERKHDHEFQPITYFLSQLVSINIENILPVVTIGQPIYSVRLKLMISVCFIRS